MRGTELAGKAAMTTAGGATAAIIDIDDDVSREAERGRAAPATMVAE